MTSIRTSEPTIVFFDGYCGLCSGVVDFLIERDHARRLRYSPLQGDTAHRFLTDPERTDLDTVMVVKPDLDAARTLKFNKSDAILECLKELGGIYRGLAFFAGLFPRFVRDAAYDFVARNRFKFFGRRDFCRAPTQSERLLFLP